MKPLTASVVAMLICIILIASGCVERGGSGTGKERIKASDLILPLNLDEALKYPKADVVAYFQERREGLEKLGNYMLENESVFRTRPVILHQEYAVDSIRDPAVQSFAQRLFQEGVIKEISSLNDAPSKTIDILMDEEPGLYRQGISYLSLPELLEGDPSELSYVKDYTDLGGSWYYYVYHYDEVKEEDHYRELAWNRLSDEERKTLTTPREKAIVAVEAGENVPHKIQNRALDVVVSVQFNTELDGLLGPIIMYFDPMTKEWVGNALRY
ncbi:hypothetical protein OMP38_09975 [Cohnella ginsengisoli]|uniref:Uncharacterized protein n=1 Tax=Cohnella ginsengisoli TaxID=425004 RepID=A0A9X4QLT2_9BACL|nr:hypothetical protein [Cohnella ginsengisoli]MDG0791164.1 hypothetical protein [Cohnella ginsengisoli]